MLFNQLKESTEEVVQYDSTQDTMNHIVQVEIFIKKIVSVLFDRAGAHDNSKLHSPEKEMYDEFTPKLKNSTYGSEEYKGFLTAMGPALKHHYENNSHHPEHYPNGIKDMDLVDLLEMIADWKAASMRHDNGDINKSIDFNKERFGYDDVLASIFKNTVDRYFSK